MQFIGTGDRILTENFVIGYLYTITFKTGIYSNSACIGIGDNFVMFQRAEPDLLFNLNINTADEVDTIELYDSGGGTNDYDDLLNRPQINSHTLTGNMSGADLGLQDTISDLDTIRAGAAAGATAVQPADMTSALAAKQDALDAAQLDAVNSGIDSTKVAQIETNKNNISLLIDNSVKNVLCIERDAVYALNRSLTWNGNTCSYNGVNYTFENGVITVNTPTAATATSYIVLSQSVDSYCNNQYILSGHSGNVRVYVAKGNYFKEDVGNGIILTPTSETNVGAIIRVDADETVNNLVITPMIRPITTDSTFEKYAPSNRELYEMILALQS
jgi:hypothetical protein